MDRRAAVIFGMCAAPRLLALALFPPAAPTNYHELATALLATGTFALDGAPSTYIEPLYPAMVAGARLAAGDSTRLALTLQIVVASIGGVLLYRLGERLAGPRAGLHAAVFYAFYPYLVRQSVAWLEITLCATLAIAAALSLTRMERIRDAMVSGVLFGLLMLTRTSFAAGAVGAAVWLGWRGRGRLAAVLLVTALLVESPWLVRNVRVDGSPLPSRIGENLYLSTSDYASVVPVHDIDLLVPLGMAAAWPEVARRQLPPDLERRALDDAMLERALAFIRERPGRVLWLKARNAAYLFSPLLLPRDAKSPEAVAAVEGETLRVTAPRRPWVEDAAHAVAQAMLLALAALGLARRGIRGGDAPLLILLAAQAAVCVAFFPTTRLMAPVMFVVMFYAAVGSTGSSAAAPPRR
jgi:hypothetical protein